LADAAQAVRSGGKNGEIVQLKMVAVRAAALLWPRRGPSSGRDSGCLRVPAGPPKAAILTDTLPVSIRPRLIDNIRETLALHRT
jgi:hypothetical protein